MNILYVFGSIGGILVIIDLLVGLYKKTKEKYKEYRKAIDYYKQKKEDAEDIQMPIGFHTEKEREEIKDRLNKYKEL